MAALARVLVARGHSVVFLHILDVAPTIARLGFDFEPVGIATHPPGWLDHALRNAGRANTLPGLLAFIRDAASITDMLCRTLPEALARLSVDFILADQNEAAGGMSAYRANRPFVTIAAALPLNWERGIPPPFVGWRYGESLWHDRRNSAGAYVGRLVAKPITDVIGSYVRQWRLGQGHQIDDFLSGFAQVSQLVPSLDFPRRWLSGCFHYCGPLRDVPMSPVTPMERGSRRAFASLGTLQGHRHRLFERIADAAVGCGLELTIAHGGLLAEEDAVRLSRRANVHDFVQHNQILPQVDVAVLHGGLNTVLDALALGVPLVVVPLAFEQGAIAARVARSGSGRIFQRFRPGAAPLEAVLKDVVANPSYSAAAAKVRNDIAASGGSGGAADIVETILRTGQPVLDEARLMAS